VMATISLSSWRTGQRALSRGPKFGYRPIITLIAEVRSFLVCAENVAGATVSFHILSDSSSFRNMYE